MLSDNLTELLHHSTKNLNDDMLKQKLSELESYATDKSQAEKRIKETEKRLKWLEGIQKQVASILEI